MSSAAYDRLRELVYPTKPKIFVGLGDPPDQRVTAEDLRVILSERDALLEALERLVEEEQPAMRHGSVERDWKAARDAIAKARGGG